MTSFPTRFLDELRARLPVSSVVGKSVKLTKKGREYLGLCPFHHEKTPSFTINDDKGFYHCFGCGAHGDIITYTMEHDKLPFVEAIEYLASLAGLTVPKTEGHSVENTRYQTYLKIMEKCAVFFHENLFSPSAQEARLYLSKRGITPALAKQFRLGYAPRSFEALTEYLKKQNIDLKEALALGVIANNKEHNSLRDYFYHRIIFPISNKRGQIIAFGGRLLEKGEPKYLNSPETPLFHKGEQLFALSQALSEIRKKNAAILVEGYMDVISLHNAGFKNAVAPLGTALTENQLKILWSLCDEPIICFDGDMAGRKAAFRALERALPLLAEGKSLRFIWLPEGLDPDDIIKKSPEKFQNLLDHPETFIDVLWKYLHILFPSKTPEQKAKFELEMNNYCNKIINKSVRTYYQKELKNKLWQFLHQKKKEKIEIKSPLQTPTAGFESMKNLLCYFIFCPKQATDFIENLSFFSSGNKELSDTINLILDLYYSHPDDLTTDLILENLSEEDQELFQKFQREFTRKQEEPLLIKKELSQIFEQLHLQKLQEQINEARKLYFENPTDELRQTLNALQEEKEKTTKLQLFS